MKIKAYVPRPCEAKVEWDKSSGDVSITPRFPAMTGGRGTRVIMNLSVLGDGGVERHYALIASAKTGRLTLSEVTDAVAEFDTLEKGAVVVEARNGEDESEEDG